MFNLIRDYAISNYWEGFSEILEGPAPSYYNFFLDISIEMYISTIQ